MIYLPNPFKEIDQMVLRLEAFGYHRTAQQLREDNKMTGMNIIGLFFGMAV